MKVSGMKPSGLSGFIEAIRFCEHVVGIAGAANCISVRAARQIEISDMNRSEKKQARILTVAEVENLEKLLMDETEELVDRFAAGSMLFALYSRSRLSDLKRVRGFIKDVTENNGTISGYLEFRTRTHKTARLVARQGLSMPLVAPVWGLQSPPWGLWYVKVAELAGRPLETLHDEALLPAPMKDALAEWQSRSVTTTEAGKWLRSLLSKRLGEIEYTTVHTLKGTPLSWCAKAGLPENFRLLLGHHSTGKQSTEVYARDVLASPLRDFDRVLQQIRSGALRPDASRSGMLSDPTREDPKDSYVSREAVDPTHSSNSSTSSSEDGSSSDESHEQMAIPFDPVTEEKQWDPDFLMFQHKRSKIVHLRAVGSQQGTFSCGVRETSDFQLVDEVDFLVFRKCKRCTVAKPVKDVGALASALKKRRLEMEAKAK